MEIDRLRILTIRISRPVELRTISRQTRESYFEKRDNGLLLVDFHLQSPHYV